MTFKELAWSFVEVYDELSVDQINDVLKINTPPEALEFFFGYAEKIRSEENVVVDEKGSDRLAEVMLMGYLLRALEGRLQPELRPAAEPLPQTPEDPGPAAREPEGLPR